jgi:hypothetical protein
MLHSKTIIQSMIARRSDEESQDTKSAEPQQASGTREYSQRETDFMRARGHHDLATGLEGKTGQPLDQSAPVIQKLELYQDHAAPVLREHAIPDDIAADIWDTFHSARDSKELIQKLRTVNISNEAKHDLVIAKQETDSNTGTDWRERVEKVVAAITSMKGLASSSARGGDSPLAASEKHPHVLQSLLDATKNEK